MQIITRQVKDKPLTVTIEYPEYNGSVAALVRKISSADIGFSAGMDGRQIKIGLPEVYYIESVERKLFIYTAKDVYRLDSTMSEVEAMAADTDLVRYFAITGIVMLFGFIVGWFYPGNFWMAFIYVGVVLVLAFFIDSFKVKKDIAFIKTKIAGRSV